MVTINKYYVQLFDKDGTLLRAMQTIASSEIEAIEKVRNEKFWYEEGVGYEYKKLEYPLTFKASIYNE